ncbi:MAG: hypothetical protein KC422_13065 [Trueperaceae bacterium]|nr:hypothetical protein [Trueperaceae bacterium]
MTRSVYQATIEELESILSPRVVSRSLQEGLRSVGKTPQSVTYDDLEKILKSQVYRQLQVAMPVTEAKTRIGDILAKLHQLEQEAIEKTEIGKVLEQQASSLHFLKERLKPFNLYFEWSEVQKLRALVQLLDAEHEAGREASKLVNDAREQLNLVEQKLEDQLVKQGQDLSDLKAIFEKIKSLGGPKVKRFDTLINQIEQAQANRQLAQAEAERARKLALDLRKLMETSIAIEAPAVSDEVLLVSEDPKEEKPEAKVSQDSIRAKLLELDLANDRRELAQLKEQYSLLLEYQPEQTEVFNELEAQLEAKQSIAARLVEFSEALSKAQSAQRDQVYQEVQAMEQKLADLSIDTAELKQGLAVSLGMLETFLAPSRDIEHLRRLFKLALEQNQAQAKQRAAEEAAFVQAYSEQGELITSLQVNLENYASQAHLDQELAALEGWLILLKEAQEAGQIQADAAKEAKAALHKLEQTAAKSTQSFQGREQGQVKHMLAELRDLQVPEELMPEAGALRTDLEAALEAEIALGEEGIRVFANCLVALKEKVLAANKASLQVLRQEAEHLGDDGLLEQLTEAEQSLALEQPNIKALELLLSHAKDHRRKEQISDMHYLETELVKYPSAPAELLEPLQGFISQAQKDLAEGKLITDFDHAWAMLEGIRQDNERRSTSFLPRLEQALAVFDEVAKLNTEEANRAGRILNHLNDHRDTFSKTSVAMQQKLEASLEEAEGLLSQLQEQFEATKAIAGQLVSGNILDSLFGPSSVDEESFSLFLEEPEAPQAQGIDVRSEISELNDWLDSSRLEPGIKAVLVFEAGSLLAGYGEMDMHSFSNALLQLEMDFHQLGEELNLGTKHLSVVEMAMHSVISAWATKEHQVVLITDQPTLLNTLLHKLRQDLTKLNLWLRNTAQT